LFLKSLILFISLLNQLCSCLFFIQHNLKSSHKFSLIFSCNSIIFYFISPWYCKFSWDFLLSNIALNICISYNLRRHKSRRRLLIRFNLFDNCQIWSKCLISNVFSTIFKWDCLLSLALLWSPLLYFWQLLPQSNLILHLYIYIYYFSPFTLAQIKICCLSFPSLSPSLHLLLNCFDYLLSILTSFSDKILIVCVNILFLFASYDNTPSWQPSHA